MIRPATLDDVDQIAALVRSSFEARLHDFMAYAQHGISHFLAVHIAMPMAGAARHFLVDDGPDGEVRAFAEFQDDAEGNAFLSYICVSPEARGLGLASGLIKHFLCSARPSSLRLDVFRENHAALAMYRKLGCEISGATAWFVRDLPAPAEDSTLRLTNAVEASAMHARYGFCRYFADMNGGKITLGRIGTRTVRFYDNAHFSNEAVLQLARALFPEATCALFICANTEHDRPDDALLFQTSLRLALHNPPLPKMF